MLDEGGRGGIGRFVGQEGVRAALKMRTGGHTVPNASRVDYAFERVGLS
jgi:hypothetical protein